LLSEALCTPSRPGRLTLFSISLVYDRSKKFDLT
jgi:hypothetical protein